MGQSHNLNIKVSDEAAEFIRGKIASGEYASESDVIQEGLAVLKQETEERALWEKAVLLPAHDRLMANAESALSLSEIERNLEAARSKRLKAS
jgi:putative addiction module CopG family antidote